MDGARAAHPDVLNCRSGVVSGTDTAVSVPSCKGSEYSQQWNTDTGVGEISANYGTNRGRSRSSGRVTRNVDGDGTTLLDVVKLKLGFIDGYPHGGLQYIRCERNRRTLAPRDCQQYRCRLALLSQGSKILLRLYGACNAGPSSCDSVAPRLDTVGASDAT